MNSPLDPKRPQVEARPADHLPTETEALEEEQRRLRKRLQEAQVELELQARAARILLIPMKRG